MKQYKNFINGEWVPAESGDTFVNSNPADTREEVTEYAKGGKADAQAAIAAAETAFPEWRATTAPARGKILSAVANIIAGRQAELAELLCREEGKTKVESGMEVGRTVDIFRFMAGLSYTIGGSVVPHDLPNNLLFTKREPLGVVALITPWNFPFLIACWKVAPALAAGNSVVLKPASLTPLPALLLGQMAKEAGLPDGVLQVLPGSGAEAGHALATHPLVRKIGFTGSTEVGTTIMKLAADDIKRVSLELGGKSPNIYFSAVMQAAAEWIDKCVDGLGLAFVTRGEVCTCPSRALVQEDMYEEFMAKVVERTKSIKRGNPLDTDVQVGAQASKEQFDKIMSYLDIGKQEGAEVLTGGGREEMDDAYNNGFYVQPTLFKGKNNMRVFQEEIFGPVVGVTTFKDEEEALAIATDTGFGLGAGLWTRAINRAYRMGRAIQAGRVWTNCYHQYPAHAAFGGYKKSGVGRENHKMALDLSLIHI